MEHRLYQHAHDLGISCITISQRLALTEFHTQELRLGEQSRARANGSGSGKNWVLRQVTHD